MCTHAYFFYIYLPIRKMGSLQNYLILEVDNSLFFILSVMLYLNIKYYKDNIFFNKFMIMKSILTYFFRFCVIEDLNNNVQFVC